ncbi:glycosyltransferase family 2 protein [Verrucomicrobiota bacterium]
MTQPKVSICVLVLNNPDVTFRCLSSLLNTDYPDFKILVVDNGSKTETQNILRAFEEKAVAASQKCSLIFNEGNVGAASARNQVLRLGHTPYIAFLDNDTEVVDSLWLSKLTDCLENHKDVAICGPKLVFPPPGNLIQSAGGGVSSGGRVCDIGRMEPSEAKLFNQEKDVQFQSSACMVLRRDVVDKAGYFDTVFDPVLFEEIDYCYRLRSLGYRIRYVPGAEVIHYENITTFESGNVNGTYLFIKHGRIFKQRWRHMYMKETGPSEEEVELYNRR